MKFEGITLFEIPWPSKSLESSTLLIVCKGGF